MILDKKDLEFYKWDGELPQLLQNVREKLNKVAEVSSLIFICKTFLICIYLLDLTSS